MNGKTQNKDRMKIAMRAGCIGILCNLLLFAFKILVGILGNSISVMADAFNNLSDAGSSVISLLGSKMAGKAADEHHPYGHGRIEYIAAFVVAFFVLEVGLKTLQSSVLKLFYREELRTGRTAILILGVSIAVKLVMGLYYRSIARRIDSGIFRASAADSFQDMLLTAATVFSILVYRLLHWNIDALVGLLLSLLVLKNGVCIIRDTLEPLIGQAAAPELYESIESIVKQHPGIYGTHDLVLHNYGPGQYTGTIHAEVDGKESLEQIHFVLDHVERQVKEETGVTLVIHADPVDNGAEAKHYRTLAEKLLHAFCEEGSLHDFRLHRDRDGSLHILFDILLPWGKSEEEENQILHGLMERMQEYNPEIHCSITLDHPYLQREQQ